MTPEPNDTRPNAVKIGIAAGPLPPALAQAVFGADYDPNARYESDGKYCRKIIITENP